MLNCRRLFLRGKLYFFGPRLLPPSLGLVVLLSFWPAPQGAYGAETDEQAREQFLKINYVFNREHYDVAIPQYEKLLQEYPDFEGIASVRYALALCHYRVALPQLQQAEAGAAIVGDGGTGDGGTGDGGTGDGGTGDGAAVPSEPHAHLRQAAALLEAALAAPEFEEKAEARRFLGQCRLYLGEHAQSIEAFIAVLRNDPSPAERATALLGIADTFYLKPSYPRAAKSYRKLLALPDLEPATRDRASFYLAMCGYHLRGDPQSDDATSLSEAATVFDRLSLDEGPYQNSSRYMAGVCYEVLEDFDTARERFAMVAAEAPDYATLGRFGLARTYFLAGDYDGVIRELRQLLDNDLSDTTPAGIAEGEQREEATLLLAQALSATQRDKEAVDLLAKLRKSSDVGVGATLELVRILRRHARHGSSARVIGATLKSFPDDPQADQLYVELARAHLEEGNLDQAVEASSALLEKHPGSPLADDAMYLKAYALLHLKKLDESRATCDAFLDAFGESPLRADIRQLIAENAFLNRRYEEALVEYRAFLEEKKARSTDPDSLEDQEVSTLKELKARYRIAQAVHFLGRYEQSWQLLGELRPELIEDGGENPGNGGMKEALRDEPIFRSYPYLLGDAAYQLENYAAANESLTTFLENADALPESDREPERESDARFKLAHARHLSRDTSGARTAYQQALASDPTSPHAAQMQFELGQLAFEEKDFDAARRSFTAALDSTPDATFAPYALRFLGWMDSQDGDYESALIHYRSVLERFPEHPVASDVEYQIALALQSAERFDEAEAAFVRFHERHPDDARGLMAQLQKAISLSKRGEPTEALVVLDALRDDPRAGALRPRLLYETAWCHRNLGDNERASEAYGDLLAVTLEENDSASAEDRALQRSARVELAELEFERGNHDSVLALLRPLAEDDAESSTLTSRALYRLCWSYHKVENHDETIRTYETFEKRHPSSEWTPELAFLAAKSHLAKAEPQQASELFQQIMTAHPTSREAELSLLGHAESLAEERDFPGAKKEFETFLGQYPDSALGYRARFGLAWAEENTARFDAAIKHYRTVVKTTSTPTAARAQFQLGQCYAAQEDYQDAVVELLQVPARFAYPEWCSKAILQVAGCFEALGDTEDAKKYYLEVVSKYPDRDEARLARERLGKLELQ